MTDLAPPRRATLSVVVPTYGRDAILIETLRCLASLEPPPDEIVVVDQTRQHSGTTEQELRDLERSGKIRWLLRRSPSIPGAMNDGLRAATGEIVLFCDDDVVPVADFIRAHIEAHRRSPGSIVAGQVIQPGEVPAALIGSEFEFRSTVPQVAHEFIGCNFSLSRQLLIEVGGFDERFVGAGFRYERELSARASRSGLGIMFNPSASVRHLRASQGGTRAWGDHLRTIRPSHAVGEYYYLLRARGRSGRLREALARPLRAVRTRHHLRRPWWIPVTLVAEVAGFLWALALAASGPKLLNPESGSH